MTRVPEISPAGSVAIGIIVGLLSTSIQSVGLTLQRKSHLDEDSKEDVDDRRPAYRRRRWQIGMLMFVVANLVGSTIQITTLPLPVLSTLQASGLVFNTICAALILGEPFTRWSLLGTVLVAGGAVLIALFGALPEPSHSLAQLLYLLGGQQFILWMVGTLLAVVLALLAAWMLSRLPNAHSPRMRVWRGMCFGGSSGILAAHSLLVAKSAVELLVRTIADRSNQFDRWQSWVILLSLVFFALSQLYLLHRGLKLCSTSVLYPFVFCIYNIIAILDGLIYFQQTSRLPALHAGLIAIGTVILLAGVFALSWRLDEDGPTPHPETHTLLTPGMGIVEDTTTESESEDYEDDDSDTLNSLDSDEEAAVSVMSHDTEQTSLLHSNAGTMNSTRYESIISPTKRNSRSPFLTSNNANRHRVLSLPASAATQNQPPPLLSPTKSNTPRRASTLTFSRPGTEPATPNDTLGRRRKWGSRYRSASLPVPQEVKQKRKKRRRRPLQVQEEEGGAVAAGSENAEGDAASEGEPTPARSSVLNWISSWWGRGKD